MSPTIFRDGSFRFYFFSREEPRIHVHISSLDGEAKFWLEPIVCLAQSQGLNKKQLVKIQNLIEENADEIRKAWKTHFGS